MSAERVRLERLAALAGIICEYHDIWGRPQRASDETLVALLADLDLDATTPERAARAEHGALAARWRSPLAPVIALACDTSPWRVAVCLPEGAHVRITWRLELEGGVRHEGEADCGALRETGRRELDGASFVVRELAIEVALPMGYHRLVLADQGAELGDALLVAAPARCYRPPALEGEGRIWGPAIQLYALRSERNWGIGDYGDLLRLVEQWSALGAGIVGLSPLHALFPGNPAHASPYSPSSRLLLNVLYLDVEAIDDFRDCEEAQRLVHSEQFQTRLARLRECELVDYPGVAVAKFEVLEQLYARFCEHELRAGGPRGDTFRAFQARGGAVLRRHALFEALQEWLHAADSSVWGWPAWPQEYRDCAGEGASRFAAEQHARVEYYEYLQWQAELQLERVAARCEAFGLAVGLYLDLAVSVDRAGSDAWAQRDCYARTASIGAPPDDFNLNGQDWGLPPLRPDRLRAQRYEPFVQALRATMRNAGALRIDHVMGLLRLYWIPAGASARAGAYLRYAFDELLAIVALESHRNRCLVIGEDLGTVPDEVREKLARAGVLSYRLLYFEREADGAFKPPQAYLREALVAVSTHDLPTLAGWWQGRDLELRASLALFPTEELRAQQESGRREDRPRLLAALERARLRPANASPDPGAFTPQLAEAVHALVAASPSRVMMLQLEDALGVTEQANLPGTVDEHPNWRRKLPLSLERMRGDGRTLALARRVALERPAAHRGSKRRIRPEGSRAMSQAEFPVTLADVRAAAARIAGAIERTPCVHSRTLSLLTGAEVWLKFENLQFTASFKERGALNRLLTLSAAERARGVIAMSAGNHAQGVAYHAARLGVRAVIVMPRGTPNTKVKNTQVHGAEVLLEGETLAEAAALAQRRATREGLAFIHPYDDPQVIAGQGTVALEMLAEVPGLDCLLVPIGGGGLISGIAVAARALRPQLSVLGVESKSYCAMYQRLHDLPVDVGGDTIAEGLAVRDVGEVTLAIVRQLVEEVLLVEEATIERAIVALIEIEKTVAEGAGAAGLAALLEYPQRFAGKRVGIPLAGGNIDTRVLAAVLMRGLVRDGRLVRLGVAMPDVSGNLARVAQLVADAGGNIVEVHHQRLFGTASVRTPKVEFVVETRDREHTRMLVAALEAKGLRLELLA